MANKKISQLSAAANIEDGDLFPLAESAGGSYTTKKIDATGVAEYTLNPISATQVSGLNKNFFINNTSWDTAAATVTQNPYLQVRQIDGKLVTGSGIGNAVGGDNMGNCIATQDVKMQGLNISGCGNIGFGNNPTIGGLDRSRIYNNDGNGTSLQLLGYQDLVLSGGRYVDIDARALDLVGTPISGNVIVTGGNLEIDPGNKLIVNEISGYASSAVDYALITVGGSLRNIPYDTEGEASINWLHSNIQYKTSSAGTSDNFDFTNVPDGQTLTLYYQNTHGSTDVTPKFRSGTYGTDTAGSVRWGAEYSNTAPAVVAGKANIYTFARINTGIFASAVTGYVY